MGTDRVDPRCVRSRQRALSAAVEILKDEGLPGLTFEAVTARSGVAKTTLYRHFPDRAHLHLAAVESLGPDVGMAVSDDVVADVVAFLHVLHDTLYGGDFGAILPTAVDGAERSPEMAAHSYTVAARRRQVLTDRLRRAQDDGVLDPAADLDMVCSQLVGPLFYRRFFGRQESGPAFVAALVDAVLRPLAAPAVSPR